MSKIKTNIKTYFLVSVVAMCSWVMPMSVTAADHVGTQFTQQDRELLIRIDERLNQIDKRFEQVDKRFEQVDKRFEELREDMNKRFEQVDKRFEQVTTFLWILSSIFTTLVVTVIAMAMWDRRTMLRELRNEIEKEGRLSDVISALRKMAEKDKWIAEIMRSVNLL